jgi:hypothetical protein
MDAAHWGGLEPGDKPIVRFAARKLRADELEPAEAEEEG